MGTAPQGWQTPKTDWTTEDPVGNGDLNRIEGNAQATELGNRDVDDSQVPASDTGTLRQLLDRITNRLKTIMGKTNWYDDPAETIEAIVNDIHPPVGTIVAWIHGYFGNGSNGSFTPVSISLPANWKLCDGSALNDPDSPIFNGAGRYLPNLTDDRFLMGDIAANMGAVGGDNAMAHTHGAGSLFAACFGESGASNFWYKRINTSAWTTSGRMLTTGWSSDTVSKSQGAPVYGSTSGASNTENRPKYLACKYIMRIK